MGTRCTVFMNSSVKQAQKDGAKIENISAGLSSSIVKNALYKVVRATDPSQLGKKIVVQGGTFLNDAVLRAFEQELNINVVRPSVAGLMGAFGCAIYSLKNKKDKSNLISKKEIENFIHDVKTANCGLCNNNCTLTINTFGADKKYISGNKCERPITKKSPENEEINLFDYKINLLKKIIDKGENSPAKRGIIGIPLVLNMFELLSFWQSFFQTLGFCVKTSPLSNREIYIKGQSTIQSDTICYPAKLVHGHIEHLINETLKHENEKIIFYPCLSYNFDEKISDNHFNCPVVAYYPEVIGASMSKENDFLLIKDYFGIDKKSTFPLKAYGILKKYFPDITLKEVKQAAKNAYLTHEQFENKIIEKGLEIITKAKNDKKQIIVLCGRPYHVDPEVNHNIDKLITSCDTYIISEEVASYLCKKEKIKYKINVLNQWTYHARLYSSAAYVATQKNMNLIQLVSFGCGVDAITTDEIKSILKKGNKIYTQIKIDEISNSGAVKIRLRSLLAAIKQIV
ncbi:MAG: acyl-CoA dehydratase activase-related protein [Clostridia bacterium]